MPPLDGDASVQGEQFYPSPKVADHGLSFTGHHPSTVSQAGHHRTTDIAVCRAYGGPPSSTVGPFTNVRDGSLVAQDYRINHVATTETSPGIQPSQSRIMLVQRDVDEEIVTAWTRSHAQAACDGAAQLCRVYD